MRQNRLFYPKQLYMRNILLLAITCLVGLPMLSQYEYEPSKEHPYGRLNPNAPKETADYAPLIGRCKCKSVARNPNQTWGDTLTMYWTFKYIMNGNGVQDETLKEDGAYSGSIRQFIPDSSKWYVHYYSHLGPNPVLPAWSGNRKGDSIVLYRPQKAPNGMDGFFKITFSEIRTTGFKWLGEWVSPNEAIRYPTWQIFCVKEEE